MRAIRKWLVPFVAVASIGLVAVTTDSGATDLPPGGAHFFDPDSNGLIVNRRPSNVSFLATGADAYRVEDNREATAGYDRGFVTQPDPDTMQGVRRIVQWPADDNAHETIATATGFLTSFESPDLVVLRGDSGRWTTPTDHPWDWTLKWYGQQQKGFQTSTSIDLSPIQGRPVGVEIVTGKANVGASEFGPKSLGNNYVLLATTAGLYVFTPCDAGDPLCPASRFRLRIRQVYPAGTTVLAVHTVPAQAVTAVGATDAPLHFLHNGDMFGVLTSNTLTVGNVSAQVLRVDFLRASGLTTSTPSMGFAVTPVGDSSTNFWPVRSGTDALLDAVPTGADLRYGYGAKVDPNSAASDLRVDVNVTMPDRSTRQFTGDRVAPEPDQVVLLHPVAGCPSPATGFDAAYFDAVTNDVRSFANARPLEAHVSCVSPRGSDVLLGGYHTTGLYNQLPIETAPVVVNPVTTLPGTPGTTAIRPQVATTLPCIEEMRYQLREDNPSQNPSNDWQSVYEQFGADRAFFANNPNWITKFNCSAGVTVPAGSGGNEQVTVMVNTRAGAADALGSLTQADHATLETASVVVPALTAADQTAAVRPEVTTTTMPVGSFLTRLFTVDTIERVRLTDASENCLSTKSAAERASCDPTPVSSAPVPIAFLVAPPFVNGSGQRGEITPEFATTQDSTQTQTKATSSSIGAEVEQGLKVEDPIFKSSSIKVSGSIGYERAAEHETSTSLTVAKSNGYGGSFEDDTAVVNLAQYLEYTGVVVTSTNGLGLCDRLSPTDPCEPNSTKLRYPVGNTVTSQTVRDLQTGDDTAQWWAPGSPFGQGLEEMLPQVDGMPGTYLGNNEDPDQAVNRYCIGDLDPRQGFREVVRGTPAPANPFVDVPKIDASAPQILVSDWRSALAGSGITSQRANLEFSAEQGEGFLEENRISASASVEGEYGKGVVGSTKATLSGAGSLSDSFEASLGRGTGFSGTVGSLPDPRLKREQFQWRMVVCKRELVRGLPVWVQNYQVRNYVGLFKSAPPAGGKEAEELGPVEDVAPVRSALASVTPTFRWKQPEGTVKSYDLELEAVGVSDHRYKPGVRTYENFDGATQYHDALPSTDTYEDYAAASMRPEDLDYTLPSTEQLRPGQVYRWRVVSNNFFYRSETSEWQYFVTTPTVSIGDAAVVEGTSGSRSARFTVSMAAPMLDDVPFHYGTQRRGEGAPGVDFVAAEGEGVIPAGATSVQISVPVKGDTAVEGDEFFQVVLDPDYPGTSGKIVGVGRIIDDDPARGAGVSIGDASVVEGRSGDRYLRFTVSRHSRKADPVTVSYVTGPGTATAGTDFVATAGTVTIGANETSTVLRIRVRPDTVKEADETMSVWLTSPTGGAVFRFGGIGTIIDDD